MPICEKYVIQIIRVREIMQIDIVFNRFDNRLRLHKLSQTLLPELAEHEAIPEMAQLEMSVSCT